MTRLEFDPASSGPDTFRVSRTSRILITDYSHSCNAEMGQMMADIFDFSSDIYRKVLTEGYSLYGSGSISPVFLNRGVEPWTTTESELDSTTKMVFEINLEQGETLSKIAAQANYDSGKMIDNFVKLFDYLYARTRRGEVFDLRQSDISEPVIVPDFSFQPLGEEEAPELMERIREFLATGN